MWVSSGREVAAGPGRDPAAERRVLEGLREVAQGQAVLAQLLLQPRARRARLDPRRQRAGVDLQHAVEPAQVDRHRRPLAQPRLDPADDAGAAAEGITAAPSASAQLSTVSISDSSRGKATRSGGFSNSPRNPRTTSR